MNKLSFYHLFIIIIIMGNNLGLNGQTTFTISSPDEGIALTVLHSENELLYYSINYKDKKVIQPSALIISLSKPEADLRSFTIISVDSTEVDETWKPVWGEVSSIRNHYKELKLHLKNNWGPAILIQITFRVFNDGVGFRYEFPQQPELKHFILEKELSQFNVTGDHKTFWIPGDYDSNEYFYQTTKLSEVEALKASDSEPAISVKSPYAANAVQTPLMMKSDDGIYINIHEAALVDYPAMNLMIDKKYFILTTTLVPDAVGNMAYLQTPARTPWRTIIISDQATDILASKMILNLNEPSAIEDVSWIKPQKFVGIWWELHVGKSSWDKASGKHGATTANSKSYIDFAALHGFDGVLVEGWNIGWEDWFGNWKEDVFDFVTPYDDYDLEYLTDYAKEKGVKIIMHHETSGSATNYERRMDDAYQLMVDHGMNSVKTGYVGKIIPRGEHHDGQWMVNHYTRVAEKAAKYKIMVDAHEPVRPTGLHRTYPNWLACEAARGNEFNAWSAGNPPEHETILPFTRLMGGPMDYTPGIFTLKLNQFDTAKTFQVHTTLCKQLALYVTMYSPLQMAADLIENYEKKLDAFQFIKDVPVDWDDTKYLEAEPGDYITVARKEKGKANWFVGAITDENSREAIIDLSFLEPGVKYQATLYYDRETADWQTNPEAYTIEKKQVTQKTVLKIHLAKGGGCAVSIVKGN
jgi:glucan 1,4-alpha-glucosidase